MAGWRFRGVLLPEGDEGELVVGDGEISALPGTYAITGLVDAHCHVTVDVGDDDLPFISDRTFADARMEELAREGVACCATSEAPATSPSTTPAAPGPVSPWCWLRDGSTPRATATSPACTRRVIPTSSMPRSAPKWTTARPGSRSSATSPWSSTAYPAARRPLRTTRSRSPAPWQPRHSLGARVAAHSTIPASHLVAIGVDSIEHGNGLTEDDLIALGARGGAWTHDRGCGARSLPGSPARSPAPVRGSP